MSMPHTCKCGTCGREMSPFGFAVEQNTFGHQAMDPVKLTAAAPAPDPTAMRTFCQKHGMRDLPYCDLCNEELTAPKYSEQQVREARRYTEADYQELKRSLYPKKETKP